MYNLKYTIPFIDIDGNNYTIQILEKDGTNSPVELTGGTPAFTVDINDEDFLYTPTRFSGATLKVVGSNYLQSLFSTDYQKFKVNLVKGSVILWTGFITPEMYSQDYDNSIFDLDIECISALSSLEYIDFKSEAVTISLLDLIKKCITESNGSYSGIYIPNVYTEPLADLTISCGNFIDEDGKPENLKTCLEELCKFLNWTVIEYNGNVYFIDVDYIKAGKTAYTKYDLVFNPTSVTLSNSIAIQNIQSKGNNNKLSILGGFNKSVVIASDYEIDNDVLYPELDADDLERKSTKLLENTIDDKAYSYIKYYFDSAKFDLKLYQKSGTSFIPAVYDLEANNRAGAILVKRTSYETNNKPNKLDYEDVIQVKLYDLEDTSLLLDNNNFTNLEVIKVREKNVTAIYDKDIKLAINFQVQFFDKDDGFVKYTSTNKDDVITGEIEKLNFLIPIQLRIGSMYYNGANWQTTPTFFRVQTDIDFNKHFTYDWFNCKNTNDFTLGVNDLEGHIIGFDSAIVGDLEMILYTPVNLDTRYNHRYIFFKDISVNSQRINYKLNQEKTDTKYENVVNESYINPLDDITFKITSKNDSGLSFSKVIYSNNLLDKLTSNIDLTQHKPEEYLINRIVNQYSQPKIKLTQIVKPDILPYSIITDSYLSGKSFLFTGGSIDYEDNRLEGNIIEIK